MIATRTSATDRSSSRRKVTALLAGGLVLGVGAAVTLAAWNDSEFAIGNFASGGFTFQGSADGTTWADHTTSDSAATLNFEAEAQNLAPEDEVYAPFALRLQGSNDALVDVIEPQLGGDLTSSDLVVDSVTVSSFGCDAAAFDGGTTTPDEISMESDDVVNLCLRVTALDTIAQDRSGSVLWQWNAESQ